MLRPKRAQASTLEKNFFRVPLLLPNALLNDGENLEMLTDFPKLHFTNGPFNEYEWEVKLKGWFSGVTVELEGSAFYAVHFYDPVRLSQELQAQLEGIAKGWNSDPYIADVAMIVVPEITESNIRLAVQRLFDANWFDRFVPLSSLEA